MSRKKKNDLETMDTVCSLEKQLASVLCNSHLPPRVQLLLLTASHGWHSVKELCQFNRLVPSQWSAAVRKKLFKSLWDTDSPFRTDVGISFEDFIDSVEAFPDEDCRSADHFFLGPPMGSCPECDSTLQSHNEPVDVSFMATQGQVLKKKKVSLSTGFL